MPKNFLNTSTHMTTLIKNKDWNAHPLGDSENWDPNLKTYIQMILNSSQPSFVLWEKERVLIPNDAMASVFEHINGIELDQTIGSTPAEIWPGLWSELEPLLKKVNCGESVFFENYRVAGDKSKQKDPSYFTFSFSPLFSTRNENVGVLCTFVENTSLFDVKEELRVSRDITRRASKFKNNFLANMSHEIRTPLCVLLGFADLLDIPGLNAEDRKKYTDIMKRNVIQLNGIINDLFDLSKIETGHMDVELEAIDTNGLLDEIVPDICLSAQKKSLSFKINKDKSYPEKIIGDPKKIKQILTNLLDNSIKFTNAGSVELSLENWVIDGKVSGCRFQITDTGVGIEPKNMDRLFKRFSQVQGGATREFGGSGIGLALSKSLANLMYGDVVLDKTVSGEGSTFSFLISANLEKTHIDFRENDFYGQESSEEFSQGALKGKNLLLVEDSPDNQRLIWHYLSSFGATVDFANNGKEGLEKASSGNYDLVLMDLQMPVMDGYTSVQKLREGSYKKPIVALTAHSLEDVKKRCVEVGFSGHLTKPIKINTMVGTILRLTS